MVFLRLYFRFITRNIISVLTDRRDSSFIRASTSFTSWHSSPACSAYHDSAMIHDIAEHSSLYGRENCYRISLRWTVVRFRNRARSQQGATALTADCSSADESTALCPDVHVIMNGIRPSGSASIDVHVCVTQAAPITRKRFTLYFNSGRLFTENIYCWESRRYEHRTQTGCFFVVVVVWKMPTLRHKPLVFEGSFHGLRQ